MKGYKKIEKALNDKGYTNVDATHESVTYGRDGREGGWYVSFDDESIPDEFYDILDNLRENTVFKDGDLMCGAIVGYNLPAILNIIKEMPSINLM